MKRQLLIIALGILFLVAITWLGTFITTYVPSHPSAQLQTTQVGAYTVSLRVDPNPPSIDQSTTLTVQITQRASHQPVAGLHVSIAGSMEVMDMETSTQAQAQGQGTYVAHVPLSMSGAWQLQVLIAASNQPTLNAVFTVTAQ